MATIKDIARRAGVSHATVSYVLNHKGNVSSAKIKAVEEAAREMGYQLNSAASALRSGMVRTIAIVIPTMSRSYASFYSAIRAAAMDEGYGTALYISGNDVGEESRIMNEMASSRASSAIVVSSLPNPEKAYAPLIRSGMRIVFSERVRNSSEGISFDLRSAVDSITGRISSIIGKGKDVSQIALVTNMTGYPNERYFKERFERRISSAFPAVELLHVEAIPSQYSKIAYTFFHKGSDPEIIVTTDEEAALAIANAEDLFSPGRRKIIFTLADSSLNPSPRLDSYFLDYSELGRLSALRAMSEDDMPGSMLTGREGFRDEERRVASSRPEVLTFLASESPTDMAIADLLPLFEKETGISVKVVFKSTREISGLLDSIAVFSPFDLVRVDMAVIDDIASSLFTPLDELPLDLDGLMGSLVEGIGNEYSSYMGRAYTVPLDPSCMLLFYRKDLFMDNVLKKRFREICRRELSVPRTFSEYKEISLFFDRMRKEGNIRERGSFLTFRPSEFIMQLVDRTEDGHLDAVSGEDFAAVMENFRDMTEGEAELRQLFWSNAADAFIHGECAMAIFYSNYAEKIAGKPLSAVSGKVGYSEAPGGHTLLGGGVLGVVRSSEKKEAVAKFISWLFSERISKLIALLSGSSPCRKAYEDSEISSLYPWMSIVRDSFQKGIRRHIFTDVAMPFDQVSLESSIGFASLNALQGIIDDETAVQLIAKSYDRSRRKGES